MTLATWLIQTRHPVNSAHTFETWAEAERPQRRRPRKKRAGYKKRFRRTEIAASAAPARLGNPPVNLKRTGVKLTTVRDWIRKYSTTRAVFRGRHIDGFLFDEKNAGSVHFPANRCLGETISTVIAIQQPTPSSSLSGAIVRMEQAFKSRAIAYPTFEIRKF